MSQQGAPPNVVYILGDDHRGELLGCLGHPVLRTPHLDGLAADGTLFRRAVCTSPLCTPSRASHYTGLWERTHGVNFNSHTALSEAAWQRSFPMRLKQAGYFTGWVGKNHVPIGPGGYKSGTLEASFDYWYGNHGHSTFYPKDLGEAGRIYGNAAADTQPEIFAEGVRNFLDPDPAFLAACSHPLPRRPVDQPFCLCVTFNLPHSASTLGMQQRPTDDSLYRSEYRDRWRDLTLPPTYRPWAEQYAKLPRRVYNGVQLVGYDYVRSPQALKEQMIRTFQTITGVDRFVGALRAQLQDLGLAENTLIVFSTDHGLHWGEHGLGGKALLYEEDLSIPLIIADPRQGARGQVRDELVAVPDLAPTVLELCGLEPSRMQGRSLAPLLRGEHPAWRDAVLVENLFDKQNYPRCEGIRAERWKYLRYFQRTEDPAQAGRAFRGTLDVYADSCRSLHRQEPVHEELFDLQNDPHESTNLIAAGHDEVLCDLRGRLVELAQALCDDRDPSDIIPIAPRGGGG